MNNKLLSFLGITRKSGNLIFGMDKIKKEMLSGKVKLILTANDISENSLNEIKNAANKHIVNILPIPYTKNNINDFLGKYSAIIGILSENFANRIKEIINEMSLANIKQNLQQTTLESRREECNL